MSTCKSHAGVCAAVHELSAAHFEEAWNNRSKEVLEMPTRAGCQKHACSQQSWSSWAVRTKFCLQETLGALYTALSICTKAPFLAVQPVQHSAAFSGWLAFCAVKAAFKLRWLQPHTDLQSFPASSTMLLAAVAAPCSFNT